MPTQILDAPPTAKAFSRPIADPEGPDLPIIDPLAWADHFENRSPEHLLRWAIERWGRRLALVTSFQSTGLVLLDMAWRIDPDIRVITLDTGRLPQETYDTMETVRRRYGAHLEVVSPDPQAIQELVRERGPNLFYESLKNRRDCCRVRKVEPLQRVLGNVDAWITGLRRDQAESRKDTLKVTFDDPPHQGLVKLAPLADWTEKQVDDYVRRHNVPRHPLYSKGYRSIGCAPCTRPVALGADLRSGRWWWESRTDGSAKECGIHLTPKPESSTS